MRVPLPPQAILTFFPDLTVKADYPNILKIHLEPVLEVVTQEPSPQVYLKVRFYFGECLTNIKQISQIANSFSRRNLF
jgi:hypothetical protein